MRVKSDSISSEERQRKIGESGLKERDRRESKRKMKYTAPNGANFHTSFLRKRIKILTL